MRNRSVLTLAAALACGVAAALAVSPAARPPWAGAPSAVDAGPTAAVVVDQQTAPARGPATALAHGAPPARTAQPAARTAPPDGTRVYGMVLDPDGEGLADGHVAFYARDARRAAATVTTDVDGQYATAQLPAGRYWARPLGVACAPHEVVVPDAGPDVRCDFFARAATGRLAGRVVDERGAPAAGVRLLCVPILGEAAPALQTVPALVRLASARTGEDGRFAMAGLPAGLVEVRLDPKSLRPRHPLGARVWRRGFAPRQVTLDGAGVVDLGTLRCERAATGTLRGTVALRAAAGEPGLAALRVTALQEHPPAATVWPRRLTLDEDGAFEFDFEVGWRVTLRIASADGTERSYPLDALPGGVTARRFAFP